MNVATQEILFEPAYNQRLHYLCSPLYNNIKQLEHRICIEINSRDNRFKVVGKKLRMVAAADIPRHLYIDILPIRHLFHDIDPEQIHLSIKESRMLEQVADSMSEYDKAFIIKTKYDMMKPRTPNQAHYIANILTHDITFGIGQTNTSKTYLAVVAEVDALERQEIRRILRTHLAIEAGEKLGFLIGDLSQNVDAYLRPLYAALFKMLGFKRVEKLIECNVIQDAPLACVRGRTLNNAFIIVDKNQNTTIEKIKMFLMHIGFNSQTVITGDLTQIDLPCNKNQSYAIRWR